MVVTKIEALTKIKYKIYIDGQFDFCFILKANCHAMALQRRRDSQETVEKIGQRLY